MKQFQSLLSVTNKDKEVESAGKEECLLQHQTVSEFSMSQIGYLESNHIKTLCQTGNTTANRISYRVP